MATLNYSSTLFTLSIACFLVCLTQTGYYTGNKFSQGLGVSLLFMGWLGMLKGIFAWMANPLLLFSWIFILTKQKKITIALSLFAIIFIMSFLFHSRTPYLEEGIGEPITSYGAGYLLWLCSAFLSLCTGFSIRESTCH